MGKHEAPERRAGLRAAKPYAELPTQDWRREHGAELTDADFQTLFLYGDPELLWYRYSGSIGHFLHQPAGYLENCPWEEFVHWCVQAKGWEQAGAPEGLGL